MALLNQMLSDKDLAQLSLDERELLVRRINFALLNSDEVRKVVGKQLQTTLQNMNKVNVKVAVK